MQQGGLGSRGKGLALVHGAHAPPGELWGRSIARILLKNLTKLKKNKKKTICGFRGVGGSLQYRQWLANNFIGDHMFDDKLLACYGVPLFLCGQKNNVMF